MSQYPPNGGGGYNQRGMTQSQSSARIGQGSNSNPRLGSPGRGMAGPTQSLSNMTSSNQGQMGGGGTDMSGSNQGQMGNGSMGQLNQNQGQMGMSGSNQGPMGNRSMTQMGMSESNQGPMGNSQRSNPRVNMGQMNPDQNQMNTYAMENPNQNQYQHPSVNSPYNTRKSSRPMTPNSNKWLDQLECLVPDFMDSVYRGGSQSQTQSQVSFNGTRTGTTGREMAMNGPCCDPNEILKQ
jgi:hypothetical protein